MSKDKKSFLIHIDSLDVLDDLTNEQAGELFNAIRLHQIGEEIELKGVVRVAFSPFKNQFKRDDEKYQLTCKRRAEAGAKGGIKSKRRGLTKKENENSFYIIKCFNEDEKFLKVGITGTTMSRRYSGARAMPYEWEIVDEFICGVTDSIFLENMVSDNFEQYNPDIKFGGYLECYNYNELDQIIAKVSKCKQTIAIQAENKTKNKTKSDNDNYIKDSMSCKPDCVVIINHMNLVLNTKYKTSTKSHTQSINARLEDGHSVEELKAVIDSKFKEWGGDPKMAQYLRPSTLFQAGKFQGYLTASKTVATGQQRDINQIGNDFSQPEGFKKMLFGENGEMVGYER